MRKIGPLVQRGDKYCFRCQTIKPTTDFYTNRSKPDGRTSQCKPCARDAQAASHQAKARLQALGEFIAMRGNGGMLELPAVIAGMAL